MVNGDDGRLALLGGTPAITLDQRPATRWPVLDDEAIAAVEDLLRKGQTSMAPAVEAFSNIVATAARTAGEGKCLCSMLVCTQAGATQLPPVLGPYCVPDGARM